MAGKALGGLRVVEYAQFISGPHCAKLMADLGAEVIKVEEPRVGDTSRRYGPFPGDIPHPEHSGLFLYLNANKLGITLDPKANTGHEILLRLLKEADILVENYPGRTMEGLGLDYASLRDVNPHLIVTSISPFGRTGPYKDYKGYSLNCSAMGGYSLGAGEPGREPLAAPLSLDHFMSGTTAALATLGAVFVRDASGKGTHVDVSEVDSWITLNTGLVVSAYIFHGMKRIRSGHRVAGPYPRTTLPCKDGYFTMHAVQGYQWKRFLEIVGDGKVPDWYEKDPRFKDRSVAGRQYADELDALLAPWMMSHTKDELFALCQEKKIPFGPVRTAEETVNDPHFADREYFVEMEHPTLGKTKYPGPPYRLSLTPWAVERTAPALGEHNSEIYSELLGYSEDRIGELMAQEII